MAPRYLNWKLSNFLKFPNRRFWNFYNLFLSFQIKDNNFYNLFSSFFVFPKVEKLNISAIYSAISLWIFLWYSSTSFVKQRNLNPTTRRTSRTRTSSRWSSHLYMKRKYVETMWRVKKKYRRQLRREEILWHDCCRTTKVLVVGTP